MVTTLFNEIIQDTKKLREVLEGSCRYGGTFESWKEDRHFISEAIHHSGTILDIGCANGFLLRCLQEWSAYTLIPYGIDIDDERLSKTSLFFPFLQNHFAKLSIRQLALLSDANLPLKYDFVYWNVWNNIDFVNEEEQEYLLLASKAVRKKGRLILGFYDRERGRIEQKIQRVKEVGLCISNRIANSTLDKVVVWMDIM